MSRLKAGFSGFFKLCRRFKWVSLMVVLLIVAGIGATVYFRQQRWENSIEFALIELNTAIATGDLDMLSRRMDFAGLASSMVLDIIDNMGPSPVSEEGPVPPNQNYRNPQRIRWMEEQLQKTLVKVFTDKPVAVMEKKAAPDPDADIPPEQRGPLFEKAREALALEAAKVEADKQQNPLPDPDKQRQPPMLPADLLQQLQNNPFKLEKVTGSTGTIVTRVEHPQAQMAVTVRLFLQNLPTGWTVRRLDGVGQIVRAYMDELNAFNSNREALFHARNDALREQMNRTADIQSCMARMGVARENGDVTLILRVDGINDSDEAFSAASVQCSLLDSAGKEVLRRQFGLTNVVKPGQKFSIDYVYDFEAADPFTAIVRANNNLKCVPQVMSVTLSSGKLLYVKPLSAYIESR